MKENKPTSLRLKEMKSDLERIATEKGTKLHKLLIEIIRNWWLRHK